MMPSHSINDKGFHRDWCAAALAATPEIDVDVVVEEETEERLDDPWKVILYNDQIHSFEEVILQLIKATGCSTQDAERIAWQAHMMGKTVAFEGTFDECFRVNGVLCEIQLVTEIEG